jgi:hypothetical protein
MGIQLSSRAIGPLTVVCIALLNPGWSIAQTPTQSQVDTYNAAARNAGNDPEGSRTAFLALCFMGMEVACRTAATLGAEIEQTAQYNRTADMAAENPQAALEGMRSLCESGTERVRNSACREARRIATFLQDRDRFQRALAVSDSNPARALAEFSSLCETSDGQIKRLSCDYVGILLGQ